MVFEKNLGHPASTGSCESSFDTSGNILNTRRCGLDPNRVEKLIISAVLYRVAQREHLQPPKLLSLGVVMFDDQDDNDEENQRNYTENQEDEEAANESFLI